MIAKDGTLSSEIQLFKLGDFIHWSGQEFSVDEKFMEAMVSNYEKMKAVAKDKEHVIPIDYAHGSFEYGAEVSKAAGWVLGLSIKDDGLYAKVRWTKNAAEYIKNEEFRFISPEFSTSGSDEFGDEYDGPVLHAAALTNVPFLKGMSPVALKGRRSTDSQSTEGNAMKDKLIKLFSLGSDADESVVVERVEAQRTLLSETRAALGLKDGDDVLSCVKKLREDNVTLKARAEKAEKEFSDLNVRVAKDEADRKVKTLLSARKIAPAQEAHWLKLAKEQPAMFDELTKDLPVIGEAPKGAEGGGEGSGEVDLHKATLKLSAEKKISYTEALAIVSQENPELVKKHAAITGRPVN